MKTQTILKYAFLHAVAGTLYITVVAMFMSNVGPIFGPDEPGKIWGPVVFLLVFVVSAAIMGSVVFLRPIMMYLDGKKKDAVHFLVYTIAFLVLIAFLIVIAAIQFR